MTEKDILNVIKRRMGEMGYSQEYVAEGLEMKQSGFSLIMSGARELKVRHLLRICEILGLKVSDLFKTLEGETYPIEERISMSLSIQVKPSDYKELLSFVTNGSVEVEMK